MIFRNIVFNLLSLIPDNFFQLPHETVEHIAQWAYFTNHYIPIDTFLSCLGVVAFAWVVCAVISGVLQLL